MAELIHDRDFSPSYGEAVEIFPDVRRITAPNAGPFTWHGTNTYLLGADRVAVMDPGPDAPEHLALIMKAAGGRKIDSILVTHTHNDHSPGARALQQACGAPILGCGPHVSARRLSLGEINPLDASADYQHKPDVQLADAEFFKAGGFHLQAIATPGHTENHLAFALPEANILFSADHVMAWSTTIVAPPDGSMRAYMASLEKLRARGETRYFPGHGGAIDNAHAYLDGLKTHRLTREKTILDRVAAGESTIMEMVRSIYTGIDQRLYGAAALSVFAHLEDLVARGQVICGETPRLNSTFLPPHP